MDSLRTIGFTPKQSPERSPPICTSRKGHFREPSNGTWQIGRLRVAASSLRRLQAIRFSLSRVGDIAVDCADGDAN